MPSIDDTLTIVPACGPHTRQDETKKRHRTEEVHLELRADVALVLLLDGTEKIDRRVVDENVMLPRRASVCCTARRAARRS